MFKNLLGVKTLNFAITLQENLGNSYISHYLNFQCDNKINTYMLHADVYICRLLTLRCNTRNRKIIFTVFAMVLFSEQVECKWLHFS